jgi:Fe2+ or Zn2+ uptake regulation protein
VASRDIATGSDAAMTSGSELAALLHRAGYRATPQRLLIAEALQQDQGHVSASELAARVQATYPYVDVSTVYRTAAVLVRLGLAYEFRAGPGEVGYEWATAEPHDHLICSRCRSIEQIVHKPLAEVTSTILDGYGFRADLLHCTIFGICHACRAPGAKTL